MEKRNGYHVLVLPYPAQGHINPMLQFSKKLISKGLNVTFAITVHVAKTMETQIDGPIKVEKISDGHDEGGMGQATSVRSYIERSKLVGSKALSQIIEKQRSSGDPISCVVYDQFYPWALDVSKQYNLIAAAFYTQSVVVSSIYYSVQIGVLKTPVSADQLISLPGLPALDVPDLPTYIADVGQDLSLLGAILEPYGNTSEADWVLFNTFNKLEVEVLNLMSKAWNVKAIGPTVPSAYLDKGIANDTNYGFNMFEPKIASCISWLNSKKDHSVIYVSFGSHSVAKQEQIEEIAWALWECDYNFLWVVRKSEENKIPYKFLKQMSTSEKGLMLSWCPQLEVLSHPAVGCFATHCGWNSVLEALSVGVPMIGFPQLSDQPTNAKCIVDLWQVGNRPKIDENGISRKPEIKTCIREIMEGDQKGHEMKNNASKWKNLAMEAVSEGGSSDKNIDEFVAQVMDFNTKSPQRHHCIKP